MKLQTRTIAFLATVWFATATTNAQITIGANQPPHTDALLDLTQGTSTTKGLLLPRMALTSTDAAAPLSAHVQGMTVYNTATVGTGATAVTPGDYYNDGTKWIKLNEKATPAWFYAPSMPIDLSTSVTNATLDLWQEYYLHFEGGGSRVIASVGAPTQPKKRFQRDELYYYVTGYDATVFTNISINANGVMTYSVNAANVTDTTFLNIVFVVR